MSITQIKHYIRNQIDVPIFNQILDKNNFKKIDDYYIINYRDITFKIFKHKYQKDNYYFYYLLFENENGFLDTHNYKLLCNKFFEKINADFVNELIESTVLYSFQSRPEIIFDQLQRRRFKKPYEQLETLIYKDKNTKDELIFNFETSVNQRHIYQLLISNQSEKIDLEKANSYVKRLLTLGG